MLTGPQGVLRWLRRNPDPRGESCAGLAVGQEHGGFWPNAPLERLGWRYDNANNPGYGDRYVEARDQGSHLGFGPFTF